MSLYCAFVWFAGFFVRRKPLRIEVLLAPDTLRHGIDQEKEEKSKKNAPVPPLHTGAST